MSGLYDSGWNPPGARKSWERTSMETKTTGGFLPAWARRDADVVEAVAWFDEHGEHLKILIADLSDGRRIDMRFGARSTKIHLSRTPERLAA